jgi:hypothetical protein
MRIAYAFTLIGIALLCLAAALAPYKDISAVENAKLDYPDDNKDSHAASLKYWAIRDAQMTPKFSLQDYGFTSLTIGFALFILMLAFKIKSFEEFRDIKTPNRKWKVVLLGVLAAISGPIVYVISLFLDMARDEFPPWADSLGLPLAGVPFLFVIMLVFAIFFCITGMINYHGGLYYKNIFYREFRPNILWCILLGIPSVVALLSVLFTIAVGDFLFLIPSLLWLFFLLSFFNGKQKISAETFPILDGAISE